MSGSRHTAIFTIFSHGIYWKQQYLSYFWSRIALFFVVSPLKSTGLALKVVKVVKVVKVAKPHESRRALKVVKVSREE